MTRNKRRRRNTGGSRASPAPIPPPSWSSTPPPEPTSPTDSSGSTAPPQPSGSNPSTSPSPPPSNGSDTSTIGSPLITPTASTLDKLDLNNKGSTVLHAIDKYSPDDRDDFVLQAERKHGLRAPAAVLSTTKSISDLRNRGQRLLFERQDGENKDGVLRKGLDAAYLASQARSQITPDEDAHEFSGTTATRKLIHGTADIIKMAATAEKKRKPQVKEVETSPLVHEVTPDAPPETPVTRPSRRDIEQYKRVHSRQAALNSEPPVRAVPKDMSKEEMRGAIRSTNSEIRAQAPTPQATRNAVQRQRQAHRNSRRRNYYSKRKAKLRHENANTSTQNIAPLPNASTAPAQISAPRPAPVPPASAPPTAPETIPAVTPSASNSTQPGKNSRRKANVPVSSADSPPLPAAVPLDSTPRPAPVPPAFAPTAPETIPAVAPQASNPTQPGSSDNQTAGRTRRQRNSQQNSQRKPETQLTPQVPLSPLQHGEPPSLASSAPQRNEKSAPAPKNEKPKKSDKKPDKKTDTNKGKKPEVAPENSKKNEPKLKHDVKKDKDNKLNFEDAQQSNTFLAQGGRYIRGKAIDKIHSEISESEKDLGNTGVEAIHKAETTAENAHNAHGKVKKLQHHIKTRHTRRANKAKAKAIRHEGKLARKALDKDMAYKGKPVKRLIQKMRIKRQYAEAFKAAKSGKVTTAATKSAAATAKSVAAAAKLIAVKAK
ncbi:MAG: hypothetical protein FWF79_00590, partial [Defluviitaleaceae bacterium]|nr:hypothetical protein [Defluviitaleaceae bacterium]